MYCALLLTGIVITSEKPFKFLSTGWTSSSIDVKIYPSYEDYLHNLNIPIVEKFSFDRDKAVAFWKS